MNLPTIYTAANRFQVAIDRINKRWMKVGGLERISGITSFTARDDGSVEIVVELGVFTPDQLKDAANIVCKIK